MQFYLMAALVFLSVKSQHSAHAFVQSPSRPIASHLYSDQAVDDNSFARFEASLQGETSSKSEQLKKKLNWQADLERLLNPTTSISQRQVLVSELIEKNGEIRASVEKAMLDRNIDPLLTPTGRRLQDGTKAVARQITRDILPSLVPRQDSSTSSNAGFPNLQDFGKTNQRFFNVLQNQLQSNLETFQQDIADPTRIPDRLRRQSETVLQEAANIFAETPAGLAELPYTVVSSTDDYEVRDYPAHMAISTDFDATALARLTSYAVGANEEQRVTGFTVPITNTGTELRFAYLDDTSSAAATATSTNNASPPTPLEEDAVPEAHLMFDGGIRIAPIPAARLAVRRFTGFITAGEVARQKQQLLAALTLDQVDLDLPHGTTVGHLVLEYNPPYTIPVVRRNEIAVPVLLEENDA